MIDNSSVACGCRLDVPRMEKVECDVSSHYRVRRVLIVSYRTVGERLFAIARDADAPDDSQLFEIEVVDDWAKKGILGLHVLLSPKAAEYFVVPKAAEGIPDERQTPFQSLQQRHKRYKKPK